MDCMTHIIKCQSAPLAHAPRGSCVHVLSKSASGHPRRSLSYHHIHQMLEIDCVLRSTESVTDPYT
eukprot:14961-Eustigmatos_ZCMA.PRE.1